MIITDKNGEPEMFVHKCDPALKGKPMSLSQLHEFGIEVIKKRLENLGMRILDLYLKEDFDKPHLIVESKNKTRYSVYIQAELLPNVPNYLNIKVREQLRKKSEPFFGKPVFVGLGFGCLTNNMDYPLLGEGFIIDSTDIIEI